MREEPGLFENVGKKVNPAAKKIEELKLMTQTRYEQQIMLDVRDYRQNKTNTHSESTKTFTETPKDRQIIIAVRGQTPAPELFERVQKTIGFPGKLVRGMLVYDSVYHPKAEEHAKKIRNLANGLIKTGFKPTQEAAPIELAAVLFELPKGKR